MPSPPSRPIDAEHATGGSSNGDNGLHPDSEQQRLVRAALAARGESSKSPSPPAPSLMSPPSDVRATVSAAPAVDGDAATSSFVRPSLTVKHGGTRSEELNEEYGGTPAEASEDSDGPAKLATRTGSDLDSDVQAGLARFSTATSMPLLPDDDYTASTALPAPERALLSSGRTLSGDNAHELGGAAQMTGEAHGPLPAAQSHASGSRQPRHSISRRLLSGVQVGMERVAKRFEAVPHDEAVVLQKLGLHETHAHIPEEDEGVAGDSANWDGTSFTDEDRRERVLSDYACALDGKVLLQGRLYVLTSYVGFYSNIMGYTTKLLLPHRSTTAVNKRRKLGTFPNTIEIVCEGKAYRFTSFLRREDAYQDICAQWSKKSGYAKLHLGSSVATGRGEAGDAGETTGVPTLALDEEGERPGGRAHGSMETPDASQHFKAGTNAGAAGTDAHLEADAWRSLTSAAVAQAAASGEGDGARVAAKGSSWRRKRERKHRGRKAFKAAGAEVKRYFQGGSAGDKSVAGENAMSGDEGDADEGSEVGTPDGLVGVDDARDTGAKLTRGKSTMAQLLSPCTMRTPTPVPDSMARLASATYPCSVPHFFTTFLANGDFETRLRQSRGDTDVNITDWTTGTELGEHVREITFVHATGQSMGPKTTRCHQVQRYRLWTENPDEPDRAAVLIEGSQSNLDIPFGDYFRVDTRFDVTPVQRPDGGPACQCVASGQVTFLKSTMFRGKIDKATFATLKPSMERHLHEMQLVLAEQMRREMGAAGSPSVRAGAGDSPADDGHEADEARIATKLKEISPADANRIRNMLGMTSHDMLEKAGEALQRLDSVSGSVCCVIPAQAWMALALLFAVLYVQLLRASPTVDTDEGASRIVCTCVFPGFAGTDEGAVFAGKSE